MSKKQSTEPVRADEGEGYPVLALTLIGVLVLAIIALGLKAMGIL